MQLTSPVLIVDENYTLTQMKFENQETVVLRLHTVE